MNITTKEAAIRLKVTSRTVRNMIMRGRFPGAYKVDPEAKRSTWMIPINEIIELEKKRDEVQN